MDASELQSLRELAAEAARLGGGILQEWAPRFTAREKSPANLVTEADLASQTAIHEHIRARHRDHRFLGEEGLNDNSGDAPLQWIIDPLDGTSNYVHRFPYYAVSVGLKHHDRLVVGAIFDPNRDEMFSAAIGMGATLNGQPIRTSRTEDIADAMCMASLPIRAGKEHPAVQRFLRVLDKAQTVQRTGSAALNMCCVACGRIDAFFSSSLNAWDQAAGAVIIAEAGGRVTRTDLSPFEVHEPDLLCSNGSPLHETLSELLME